MMLNPDIHGGDTLSESDECFAVQGDHGHGKLSLRGPNKVLLFERVLVTCLGKVRLFREMAPSFHLGVL